MRVTMAVRVRAPRPAPPAVTAGAVRPVPADVAGRVLVPDAAVPRLPRVGFPARRGSQVCAGADDPDQEQEAGDGADHDARDGSAREVVGFVAAGVVKVWRVLTGEEMRQLPRK